MKKTEVLCYKKLSLLLAMLLCSVFAFAVPLAPEAAPATPVAEDSSIYSSDEVSFLVEAGEVSAGEVEGVLQKTEKDLRSPLAEVLLQLLYPQQLKQEAIPAHYPFQSGKKLLHSILTKGP